MSGEGLKKAPGAWDCKAQIYAIPLYVDPAQADNFPAFAYPPLEGSSSFAKPQSGRPVGGLGQILIVRYSETPVGPYDELAILPGPFAYPGGEGQADGQSLRITRIYVSQRDTVWNGRLNWNIPKHLARFDFTDLPNNTIRLRVYPFDDGVPPESVDKEPSSRYLFQVTFKPVPYTPAFPATTSALSLLGMKPTIVQPPLPQGTTNELIGTDRFAKADFAATSWWTRVGWFDMNQADDDGKIPGEHENFWPGTKRWLFGARMDDAAFHITEGQYWKAGSE